MIQPLFSGEYQVKAKKANIILSGGMTIVLGVIVWLEVSIALADTSVSYKTNSRIYLMKQKTINEVKIKVCDTYPVEKKFDFDEEIVITLKGEVVKKEIRNNQDESVDLVLTFKALDYKINKV